MISRFTKQLKGAAILGALLVGSNAFAQLGLKWGELGPNDISGRCRSVIVDNTDGTGNRLFAAGVSGGVFKSTDAGSNWMAINDQAQSLIVSSMAQDAAGNIFFGTGETFGRGGDGAGLSGFIGTGLFKIAASSTVITALADSSLFGNINEVAVAGTNTVYVAADRGFFISTNGGTSFVEETVSATGTLAAMDVKVATNGDVYYSAGAKDYSLSAVYFSASGSSTYSSITPTVIANRGRIEIAISNLDPNYVYLSIAKQKTATGSSGGLSAVMISNNKGVNWSTITIGSSQFDPFMSGTTGYGDYANTIVVDPINKNTCYLGSQEFYGWTQLNNNPLGQGTWYQIAFTTIPIPSASYVHSKIHDLKFHVGTNTGYIATDAGIFKGVSNLSGFLPYNKGLNISQFNSVTMPLYPAANVGPTNTVSAIAGVAGGSIGNNLTYLPGYYLNGPMTSKTFGSNDAYQADFSTINPKAIVYAGANGSLFRTNDIDVAAPATFYDNSYRGALGASSAPGSVTFANENTPARLWEQYKNADTAIYLNEQSIATVPNINNTKTKFSVVNVKGQRDQRYERIYITTASTKSLSPPANQTITIVPLYNGPNVIAAHVVTGNANTSSVLNNRISLSTNTATPQDSIYFEFATAPKDSSVITVVTDLSFQTNENVSTYGLSFNTSPTTSTYSIVSKIRPKKKYHYTNMLVAIVSTKLVGALPTQTVNIAVGNYSGNSIPVTSQTVTGAAIGATIALNNNSTYKDTLKLNFAGPTDSCRFDLYTDYITYDSIIVKNTDVSGYNFETGQLITGPLSTSVTPVPVTKLPLRHSARYAVGIINTTPSTGPSVFVTKKPLNFSLNPDYVKIAGKFSKIDGPGGLPTSTVVAPITGSVVTRLEWAHDGKCIYFSTKLNDTSYFFYRISHLEFIGDSTDYSGAYASDVDINATTARPNVPQRTTPLGRFKYPITGIAISSSDTMVAITCGGYKNKLGTVYYSNMNTTKMNMNNTNTANFDIKNGGTLPFTPAYTGIFEMSDDKTVLVGTESGVYSTTDITQPSPNWVKEVGATNNFPNVPVFQLRQQKEPSYRCYNSGVIYAATHGRGIWSTDKFFTAYGIGIVEQENLNYGFTSNIKLMPNPAGDATSIWFKASSDAAYRVSVYDINGRLMIQETTGKLMEGEQVLNLNTSQLTSGVYFVTVVGSNNFSANSKLVITH